MYIYKSFDSDQVYDLAAIIVKLAETMSGYAVSAQIDNADYPLLYDSVKEFADDLDGRDPDDFDEITFSGPVPQVVMMWSGQVVDPDEDEAVSTVTVMFHGQPDQSLEDLTQKADDISAIWAQILDGLGYTYRPDSITSAPELATVA